MKTIVTDAMRVAQFVGDKCNATFAPPFSAIGLSVDGQIIAGIVFTGYDGRNVDMTIAGEPSAWTPLFVRRCAHYAFIELKAQRVSAITKPYNAHFLTRMGAVAEGVALDWYGPGQHGTRWVILLKDWKFR